MVGSIYRDFVTRPLQPRCRTGGPGRYPPAAEENVRSDFVERAVNTRRAVCRHHRGRHAGRVLARSECVGLFRPFYLNFYLFIRSVLILKGNVS